MLCIMHVETIKNLLSIMLLAQIQQYRLSIPDYFHTKVFLHSTKILLIKHVAKLCLQSNDFLHALSSNRHIINI
jgi:hypothetical protein